MDYKKQVLEKEEEINKKVKKANLLYSIDNYKNYNNNKYNNGTLEYKTNMAIYIANNFNKMDIDEMKYLVLKCLSEQDYKRILLEYELLHYPCNQQDIVLTLDEFIKRAKKILNRYQSKGGGYKLEDIEWTIYEENDSVYFENTIDSKLINDDELNVYFDKILEKLNELSMNIQVELILEKHKSRVVIVKICCSL